jgi:hypothetical protein
VRLPAFVVGKHLGHVALADYTQRPRRNASQCAERAALDFR